MTTEEVAALKARLHDLEAALHQNDATLAITFHLTPMLANVFGLLMTLNLVTTEMIHQRLELTSDGKVTIHRLREHLKDLHKTGKIPFPIEVQSKRKVGYWFDKETKDRVKTHLEKVGQSYPDRGKHNAFTPVQTG